MGNVIHRNTKWLKVRRVSQDFCKSFPEEFIIYKDEFDRWTGIDKKKTFYSFSVSHLRNENLLTILEQQ